MTMAVLSLSLLLGIPAAYGTQVKSTGNTIELFTNNPVCVQNSCINPMHPGLDDLPRLEKLVWQCSKTGEVKQYLDFCKGSFDHDPSIPSPPNSSTALDVLVKAQDDAAATMFFYHLSGLGYEAWEYKTKAARTENPCVQSVWKMVCYTYFPKNQAGCTPGAQTPYLRPCKNGCENYLAACQVECCDDSAQCVFEYDAKMGGGAMMKQTGYVDENGPSAICTGGSSRSGVPMALLLALFGFQLATSGPEPSQSSGETSVAARSSRRASSGGLPNWVLMVVLAVCTVSLQGCSIAVPSHKKPNWRAKSDYLVKYEYVPPGQLATDASLNSCNAKVASGVLQCSGRGECIPFSKLPLSMVTSNHSVQHSAFFCKCDSGWADPECRTKRKSQITTYGLTIFAGFLGADLFYLGYFWTGLFKLVITLCAAGLWSCFSGSALILGAPSIAWWMYDIIRVGSAPVYASDYRVNTDLPHWVFMLSVMLIFGTAGFLYSLESYVLFRKKKRAEVLKLHEGEEDRTLSSPQEMDGPRYRPRGHSTFYGQHSYSGYGATLPMPLPNGGAPYVP
mmetsp:Transcript_94696/g.171003  ORF Transcript_94696/g.171003 Transcript_94696/m.171003 type:complete len:563 (+) Transcript_94696:128-1816(+)